MSEDTKDEEERSDGVVRSEFVLRTKTGDEMKIISHMTKTQMTNFITETLQQKKPFVFPSQDEAGRVYDTIIPYDLIIDARVWEFSHIVKATNKVLRDKKIQ